MDGIVVDHLEGSLLVKVKQEPLVPSTRCGAFHFWCLFGVLLYSVQFGFVCFWISSTFVTNVDNRFSEQSLVTAPISPTRLDS